MTVKLDKLKMSVIEDCINKVVPEASQEDKMEIYETMFKIESIVPYRPKVISYQTLLNRHIVFISQEEQKRIKILQDCLDVLIELEAIVPDIIFDQQVYWTVW